MTKLLLAVFFGLVFVVAGISTSFALQSGGMGKGGKWAFVGDLETGRVAGIPFKQLDVSASFNALDGVGGKKVWYPPYSVIDLKGRAGRPVVLKVTNNSKSEHGFNLAADGQYFAPTSLNIKIVLKPGETKYIGIPTSDLTYVTAGSLLRVKCQLHEAHLGAQLEIRKYQ